MKPRSLNQKLGKRTARRAERLRTKTQARGDISCRPCAGLTNGPTTWRW